MNIRIGLAAFTLCCMQPAWADSNAFKVLSDTCHVQWETFNWTMGEGRLAKDIPTYNQGIKRVCQAKAELYLEGYEINPSIDEDDQEEVSRLVFLPSVDMIKTQMKVYLPNLRVL